MIKPKQQSLNSITSSLDYLPWAYAGRTIFLPDSVFNSEYECKFITPKPKINLSIKKEVVRGIDFGGKTDNYCVVEMHNNKIRYIPIKIDIQHGFNNSREIEIHGYMEAI